MQSGAGSYPGWVDRDSADRCVALTAIAKGCGYRFIMDGEIDHSKSL
jgi:hypothetical protein